MPEAERQPDQGRIGCTGRNRVPTSTAAVAQRLKLQHQEALMASSFPSRQILRDAASSRPDRLCGLEFAPDPMMDGQGDATLFMRGKTGK